MNRRDYLNEAVGYLMTTLMLFGFLYCLFAPGGAL
jgi:hypothetical protein